MKISFGNSRLASALPLPLNIINYNYFRARWDTRKHIHNLRHKADHLHIPEIQEKALEARARRSLHKRKEAAAEDTQRGRLRDSSLPFPSNKRKRSPKEKERKCNSKRPRLSTPSVGVVVRSRRELLEKIVSNLPRPRRYDLEAWRARRATAIIELAYIFPDIDFNNFCKRVNELALRNPEHGLKNLSASELLSELGRSFPALSLSAEILRLLLKSLSFDWLKTHSAYYDSIFNRYDIIEHRAVFCPLWRFLLTSDRVFLAIGDASHQHQNERNSHGWIDKTIKNSDQLPSGAGLGSRVNFWTFITREGILEDAAQNSTTVITEPNTTMEGDDIVRIVGQGAKAMSEHPAARGKMKVLSIDGALINKMFPPGSIIPSKINAKDGGKNRSPMNLVGLSGLHRILTAMGKEVEGLTVEECRSILWECDVVRAQLTATEAEAAKYGVIVIFTPKSPPRFSTCENYFRMGKRHLQNLFDVNAIQEKIREFETPFRMSRLTDESKRHIDKWFSKSLKYANYFAKGGLENIRENEMENVDLQKMECPLPPLISVRRASDLSTFIHNSNWVLIRGKHYPKSPKPWNAPRGWVSRLGQDA